MFSLLETSQIQQIVRASSAAGGTNRNQRSLPPARRVVVGDEKLMVLFSGQQVYQGRACNTFIPRQEVSFFPKFRPFQAFLFNGGTVNINLLVRSSDMNESNVREEVMFETLASFSRL